MAFTLLLAGCSVKENRLPCPCYIDFEPEEGLTETSKEFSFLVYDLSENIHEQRNEITWKSVIDNTHFTSVRKSVKMLTALQGQKDMVIEGRKLMIPLGSQCDSIRAWSEQVDCTFEKAVMPVQMTKHWATVMMKLENGEEKEYPYDIRIRSNVAGIDMETLSPIEGDYSFEPLPQGIQNNVFIFRLPRQIDNSLYVEMNDKDTGITKAFIPMGTLVEKSGFDWNKKVLDDINIGLDYAVTGLHIIINDWETVYIEEKI